MALSPLQESNKLSQLSAATLLKCGAVVFMTSCIDNCYLLDWLPLMILVDSLQLSIQHTPLDAVF